MPQLLPLLCESRLRAVTAVAILRIDPTSVDASHALVDELTGPSDWGATVAELDSAPPLFLALWQAAEPRARAWARLAVASLLWNAHRDPAALRQAVELGLRDTSWDVQRRALALLREAPCHVAVPLLVTELASNTPGARGRAADALGALGPAARDAVPALIGAMTGDGPVRVEVVRALGRIGPSAAAAGPLLEPLLRDFDFELREAAEVALDRIRAPR